MVCPSNRPKIASNLVSSKQYITEKRNATNQLISFKTSLSNFKEYNKILKDPSVHTKN